MSFGLVIRSARKNQNLTQEGLASKVGCTRTTICDWEKEKYPPTDAGNINALEIALGFEQGRLYSILYPSSTSNPTLPRCRPGRKAREKVPA
jgi:transcriptional regulator with XRE-family HTH domain